MPAIVLPTPLDKTDVQRIYTGIAPWYDLSSFFESPVRRASLEMSSIRDGESVLEVGVGTGLLFAEVLSVNPGGRSVGIDLTEAMLERARRRAGRSGSIGSYELRVGDAYALDLGDKTFDVVLSTYMFDVMPEGDFPRVLSEMFRVLRPGGRIVLANMTPSERWYQNVPDWIFKRRPSWMGGCRGVRLAAAVAAAGFECIERREIGQLIFASEIVSARRPESPPS